MKIFPLKLMSNYDKYKNLQEIMKNVQIHPSNTNKYKMEAVVNTDYYTKKDLLDEIIEKHSKNLKEIVSKIKKAHNEKISRS